MVTIMLQSIRTRIAHWLAPEIADELRALRSGNTKVVLENVSLARENKLLLDQMAFAFGVHGRANTGILNDHVGSKPQVELFHHLRNKSGATEAEAANVAGVMDTTALERRAAAFNACRGHDISTPEGRSILERWQRGEMVPSVDLGTDTPKCSVR